MRELSGGAVMANSGGNSLKNSSRMVSCVVPVGIQWPTCAASMQPASIWIWR
jgi:hypothetical protein